MPRNHPTAAPNGVTNDNSVGYKIVISSLVSIILAVIFVLLRLITKLFVTHAPGWDDYTAVIALGFAIARVVGNLVEVYKYQVGHHVWDVDPTHFHHLLSWYLVDNVLYLFAIMFAKISILLLYLRLFQTKRKFKWLCWGMLFVVIGYCFGLSLSILFNCHPLARTWDSSIPGHCLDIAAIDFAIGGLNIGTDCILLVLPLFVIFGLHLSTRRMIGLAAVFATGIFVCATTIVREVIVVRTLKDKDQTVSIVDDIMWLTLEVNIGIVCGCLPVLPAILRPTLGSKFSETGSYFKSWFSRGRSSRGNGSSSGDSISQKLRDKAEYLELVQNGKVEATASGNRPHGGFNASTESYQGNDITVSNQVEIGFDRGRQDMV